MRVALRIWVMMHSLGAKFFPFPSFVFLDVPLSSVYLAWLLVVVLSAAFASVSTDGIRVTLQSASPSFLSGQRKHDPAPKRGRETLPSSFGFSVQQHYKSVMGRCYALHEQHGDAACVSRNKGRRAP